MIIYYGVICTISDPTDEIVKQSREAEAKGYSILILIAPNWYFREFFDTSRYDFYCATCKSSVRDNSKHCW